MFRSFRNRKTSDQHLFIFESHLLHVHSVLLVTHSYQVSSQVRNCDLLGLRDLDYSQSYVLNKVAAYLNKLIDLGVAGFRVDAAKHMWLDDISALQKKAGFKLLGFNKLEGKNQYIRDGKQLNWFN